MVAAPLLISWADVLQQVHIFFEMVVTVRAMEYLLQLALDDIK
jgi:hypothetical protein